MLGSIRDIRNLENHLQNSIWVIYLLAMGLRVQPLKEIGHNFATFTCLTKMPLTPLKINEFSNFQVLLLLETLDNNIWYEFFSWCHLFGTWRSIYTKKIMKNQPKAYLGLQESPNTPYAATFDHTTWKFRYSALFWAIETLRHPA